MATEDDSGGRLARWSRLKTASRAAARTAEAAQPEPPVVDPVEATTTPPPGYAEVELLTPASDYARFMGGDVDGGVQRAALKKLFFSDPHFNLMDGLDTYIDDYNTPDPLPLAMLRQLHQSQVLGLFEHEEEVTVDQAPEPASLPDDDHPDLRLQQDDDAGRPGADEGARP